MHGGRKDKLTIAPNLWAGVGLVRGGAGTALVGNPQQVADRMKEYMALGIDRFILSGYPHLEECYRFAELVFPLLPLRKTTGNDLGAARNAGPFGEIIANVGAPTRMAAPRAERKFLLLFSKRSASFFFEKTNQKTFSLKRLPGVPRAAFFIFEA